MTAVPRLRRVAMLSVHTSPLEQPGTGDAGGLNVYVVETARRLAARGVAVEVFTRATSGDLPPGVELAPGVTVRHVTAGPYEGLGKDDLPGQLCAFTAGVMRTEARRPAGLVRPGALALLAVRPGRLAGRRALAGAARALDAHHGPGQEPRARRRATAPSRRGGRSARRRSSRPPTGWWPTPTTRPRQLVELYDADPGKVGVVPPGRRPRRVPPRRPGRGAGATAASRPTPCVLLFVGRIQPLKAPDVLLRAAAELLRERPELRADLVVAVLGGPSGTGLRHPSAAAAPGRSARDRGAGAVRAAGRPGRSWPAGTPPPTWWPCRRTTRVRAGRGRGAGLRHPGGGRRRRGAADRARGRRRARTRPRDPQAGAPRWRACWTTTPAAATSPPGASPTPRSSAGSTPRTSCWRSTPRRSLPGTPPPSAPDPRDHASLRAPFLPVSDPLRASQSAKSGLPGPETPGNRHEVGPGAGRGGG